MKATLNLFTTALEIDDHTVATARQTPNGWYWFTNVGRVGRKTDFPDKEAALRAAAKALRLDVTEVIPETE